MLTVENRHVLKNVFHFQKVSLLEKYSLGVKRGNIARCVSKQTNILRTTNAGESQEDYSREHRHNLAALKFHSLLSLNRTVFFLQVCITEESKLGLD